MNTLIHIHVSPWSERARWALDACGIEYTLVDHVPFVGEVALRRKARSRRATAPLLLTDEGPVMGSFAIARWADAHGRPRLFPEGRLEEIERLDALSERALNVARARAFPRLAASDEAIAANIPKPLRVFGPITMAAARWAVRYMAGKYEEQGQDDSVDSIRAALLELRGALGGRATVLEEGFSYADITMAVALQGISAPADRWLKLPPTYREVWLERELAEELADLLAWRDGVYDAHRAPLG